MVYNLPAVFWVDAIKLSNYVVPDCKKQEVVLVCYHDGDAQTKGGEKEFARVRG